MHQEALSMHSDFPAKHTAIPEGIQLICTGDKCCQPLCSMLRIGECAVKQFLWAAGPGWHNP